MGVSEAVMLITDSTWERIREQFSEDEKKALRCHVTGETICPRGIVVDEDALSAELRDKLIAAKRDPRCPMRKS
jgi:hypothetical protein